MVSKHNKNVVMQAWRVTLQISAMYIFDCYAPYFIMFLSTIGTA